MRCKACDAVMDPVWDEARGQFEELCPACLSVVVAHSDDLTTTKAGKLRRIKPSRRQKKAAE